MRNQIYVSIITLYYLFFGTIGITYAGTWQETLEQQFDIVETFDNLQNWHGTKHTSANGEVANYKFPDDFPKKLDGSPSMWCMYSKYRNPDPNELDWIGNFGSGTYCGSSGKSAIIDLSNTRGPSRLGLYFGNGSSDSGYRDLYIFRMTKISRKQWPTNREAGIYEDGKPYAWIIAWKFDTMGTGFNDGGRWNNAPLTYERRYGDAGIVSCIGINNYGSIPRLDGKEPKIQNNLILSHIIAGPSADRSAIEATDGAKLLVVGDNRLTWEAKGCTVIADDWMGVEYHYVLENPVGAHNGILEAWIYNKDGECLKAFRVSGFAFRSPNISGPNHLFNRFFFGGNNSGTYKWGPTMEAPYYVDDLIIDNQRIGPKYFDLVHGRSPEPGGVPSKPSGFGK